MRARSSSISKFLLAALSFTFLSACTPAAAPSPTASPAAAAANILVTSTAFVGGGNIPARFTCSDQGISPELKWSDAPRETQSYALIVDDPDAPVGTFTHWVAFDIPAAQTEIPQGANTTGKSGRNSAGKLGYVPPCPPSGTHRYIFTVYALDLPNLGLSEGASRDQVLSALKSHTLAQGQLTGRYSK